MIYALFGGVETKPEQRNDFSVQTSDLEGANEFHLEVFSERKICGFFPKIKNYKILNELKKKLS